MDLSLISFDDLMEELKKRFHGYIFHGVKNQTKEENQYFADYYGGKCTCIGLCKLLEAKITDQAKEELEHLPPGEDGMGQ